MSVVISDTSPLNYLILIDHADLLRELYGKVIIPHAVLMEMCHERTPGKVRQWIASLPEWLEVRTVNTELDGTLDFLDPGEREAMILAKELNAAVLVIDEIAGREEAKRRGLTVIGRRNRAA